MGEGSSFSLVKFEGKPLEKLVEVVSQGIGKLYEPRGIRKKADADAYKIEVIEKAKSKAFVDGEMSKLELYENIQQRLIYQETKKQNNIDNVVDIAVEQIKLEENVSEEKVDPDWSTRFFNIAEDISNDEMQKLWGRILAGEIKQPKSFSLRTLELLKNLSKDEAEIFEKFCHFKITIGSNNFVLNMESEVLDEKYNITYADIILLTELDLLASGNNLALNYTGSGVATEALYRYGEIGICSRIKANTDQHTLKIIKLTKPGVELSRLINQDINIQYINDICNAISTPHTEIIYGKLDKNEDGVQYITDVKKFEKQNI